MSRRVIGEESRDDKLLKSSPIGRSTPKYEAKEGRDQVVKPTRTKLVKNKEVASRTTALPRLLLTKLGFAIKLYSGISSESVCARINLVAVPCATLITLAFIGTQLSQGRLGCDGSHDSLMNMTSVDYRRSIFQALARHNSGTRMLA